MSNGSYITRGGMSLSSLRQFERACEEAISTVRAENTQLDADNKRLRHAISTIKEKGAEALQAAGKRVAQSTEIGGASFAFGVVAGRWGEVAPLGIPIDAGTATLLHLSGLAMSTLAPAKYQPYADHIHNLGDGAFAAFMHSLGAGLGVKWLAQSMESSQPQATATTAGELVEGNAHSPARFASGADTRAPMTFDELAAAALAAAA